MKTPRFLACVVLLLSVVTVTRRTPDSPPPRIVEYRLLAEDAPPPTPSPTIAPTPVPVPAHAAKRTLRPSRSSPTVPGPAVSYSEGSVQARIVAAWPGDDAKVLRVIRCESNFNPGSVSRSGKYRGLLQADGSFWASYGGLAYAPSANLASVEGQIAVMWRGYQARGWGPWPVCGKR